MCIIVICMYYCYFELGLVGPNPNYPKPLIPEAQYTTKPKTFLKLKPKPLNPILKRTTKPKHLIRFNLKTQTLNSLLTLSLLKP